MMRKIYESQGQNPCIKDKYGLILTLMSNIDDFIIPDYLARYKL